MSEGRPDELIAPPSRWRAHGRPALARAIASGAAAGLSGVPLVLFLRITVDADLSALAIALAIGVVAGACAGAPGAALEDWAERRPGSRSLSVPLACGLLVPLAVLLLALQLAYARGVLAGGIGHGLDRFASMLDSTRADPARAIGMVGGIVVGLAPPVSLLVWVRLRRMSVLRQALLGLFGIAATGVVTLIAGSLFLYLLTSSKDIAPTMREHPILGGLAGAAIISGALLLLVGLAMALLLPPALAAADRFRAEPRVRPDVV